MMGVVIGSADAGQICNATGRRLNETEKTLNMAARKKSNRQVEALNAMGGWQAAAGPGANQHISQKKRQNEGIARTREGGGGGRVVTLRNCSG
jgi:hypothetical protein